MPEWLLVVGRTLVAIVVLFIATKALGKRQLSQLSLFEYITGITIGNIAAYVSLDLENLWLLGIIAMGVWVAISASIEFLTLKNRKIKNFVDGKGSVLIKNGKVVRENMRKEKLTIDELLSQLRQKDIFSVADVEFALMESSGSINVLLKKENQPLTGKMLGWPMASEQPPQTVLMDGEILEGPLKVAGYDEKWLEKQLDSYRLKLNDVFIGQIECDGTLSVQTKKGESFPEDEKTGAVKRINALTSQLEKELLYLQHYARNEHDRKLYNDAIHKLRQP